MVWNNKLLAIATLLFVFCAPFAHADDDLWGEYQFDAHGSFKLVSVTHNESPYGTGCTFTSAQGSVAGSCSYDTGHESGTGTGGVTWTDPPSTGMEGQNFTITSTLSTHTEGDYYGSDDANIGIGSWSGECTSFQDIGTPFSIAGAYAQKYDAGSANDEGSITKTLDYRFPTFYKPWICDQMTTAENNKGQSGDIMRAEAMRSGVYFFNMTISASTVGGSDTYTYTYEWVPGNTVASADLSGKITDGHGDPMPYANVTLDYLGKHYGTIADEAGNYVVSGVAGLTPDSASPPTGVITVYAEYWRDGKNYFSLYDMLNQNTMVFLQKKFVLKDSSDTTQNIDFNVPVAAGIHNLKAGEPGSEKVAWLKDGEEVASASSLKNLWHFAPVYYYTANAVDFDLTILQANIDYKLPVKVFLASSDGTYYSRPTASIHIDKGDVVYSSSDRPRNREYHEFSHHLMFSQWNGEGLRSGNDTNHGGFINSNTADSYTEGFAEFMALVIADYTNNPNDPAPSDIYAGFGSLKNKYKPWGAKGSDEEFAIAGVLWDIYDKNNNAEDTVSIPIQQLWPILSVKRANFLEYADAIKAAFPGQAAGIDKILVAHGFYADGYVGNKVRDAFEPYIDSNGDKNYTPGEYFVDYGIDAARAAITYENGDEIGRATNYERPTRGQAVEVPNAFLSVSDMRVPSYNVSVHFNNARDGRDYSYLTDMRDGKIYLQPLPEGIDATMTVAPASAAYSSANVYTITSTEYLQKYYAAPDNAGSFDSFDFGLSPTGTPDDSQAFSDGTPRWGTDNGTDAVDTAVGQKPTSLPLSGGITLPCLPGLVLLGLVAVVSMAGARRQK